MDTLYKHSNILNFKEKRTLSKVFEKDLKLKKEFNKTLLGKQKGEFIFGSIYKESWSTWLELQQSTEYFFLGIRIWSLKMALLFIHVFHLKYFWNTNYKKSICFYTHILNWTIVSYALQNELLWRGFRIMSLRIF